MPKPSSFGKIDFKVVASMEDAQGVPEPETRFRVLVLGESPALPRRPGSAEGP